MKTELEHQIPPQTAEETFAVSAARLHGAVRHLWRRKWRIIGAGVCGAVMTALLALIIPVKYDATALLMPPSSTGGGSALSMLASLRGNGGPALGAIGDLLGTKSPGELLVRALQTRRVQDRLIERFKLNEVYHLKSDEKTRFKLAKRTDIKEDRKSGVISITVLDREPQRAADIANAYAEELDRMMVEVNIAAARQEREFLTAQLTAARRELDEAAAKLSAFASRNAVLEPQEQGKAMVESVALVQGQIIAAEAEMRGLQQIYTDQHPRVQQLKASIAELQSQRNRLEGSAPAGASGTELPSLKKLPKLAVDYMNFYRDAKVREVVYELLTQQYEMMKLQDRTDAPNVQLLDRAMPAEKPVFPPTVPLVAAGGALSLLFVFALFAASYWWSTADPNDPRYILLAPLVDFFGRKRAFVRVRRLL